MNVHKEIIDVMILTQLEELRARNLQLFGQGERCSIGIDGCSEDGAQAFNHL